MILARRLLNMMIMLLAVAIPAVAQSDMILSQHWAVPTLYNPSRVGETDFLRIRGAARLQWIGVDNAPKSFVAAADIPWVFGSHRVGAGVNVLQESIGLFRTLLVNAQAAYQLKFLKGTLSLGLQAGYYNSRFRGSDVYIPDDDDYHQPDDPSIPKQDLSGNSVDLGLGISYSTNIFHVGIAAQHLSSPKIRLERQGSESSESQRFETELPRTLYLSSGGNIALKNTLFVLQPDILLASDFSDFSAALSLRTTYNNFLSFGVGYRWNDAVSLMVGANFRNFFLGYAFDYPTSDISKVSSGSHEIVAGYSLKLDLAGKNKHKHRSIRIM